MKVRTAPRHFPRLSRFSAIFFLLFLLAFFIAPYRKIPKATIEAVQSARDIVPNPAIGQHASSAESQSAPQKPLADQSAEDNPTVHNKPPHEDLQPVHPPAVKTEQKLDQPDRPAVTAESPEKKCLKFFVYDKPVKTGSTAVTKALKKYLEARRETYHSCTFENCTKAAEAMCAEQMEKRNLIEHQIGKDGLINCLGNMGFYRITSVRAPLQRWESSYLYNQKKNGSHYGIHNSEPYSIFMNNYPTCALHHYYDNLGRHCDRGKLPPAERTARIVERYDEVIDLYNEGGEGQMHLRLQDMMREENKSPRPDTDFREPFNETRMADELHLYQELKRKQKELLERKRAILC